MKIIIILVVFVSPPFYFILNFTFKTCDFHFFARPPLVSDLLQQLSLSRTAVPHNRGAPLPAEKPLNLGNWPWNLKTEQRWWLEQHFLRKRVVEMSNTMSCLPLRWCVTEETVQHGAIPTCHPRLSGGCSTASTASSDIQCTEMPWGRSQNHGIIKVGKDFQVHQVQPSS